MNLWNEQVQEVVTRAGWYRGRRCPRVAAWAGQLLVEGGFVLHPAAEEFLSEFGEIAVAARPGSGAARRVLFDIDPTVAAWEEDRFADAAEEIGAALFPLGEALSGQFFLAMDPAGRVFLVMDVVEALAPSGPEALARLLVEHPTSPLRSTN